VFSLEEKNILNPLKVEGKPNWKGKSQGRHQTQTLEAKGLNNLTHFPTDKANPKPFL
jgi:hypothetical protein